MTGSVTVYGIRHHGPGSARSLQAALEQTQPTVLLVEGPPEGDHLVTLLADPEVRLPVALLAYVADSPERSSFWPFAEYSPETVALRWALGAGVPTRFVDLPARHSLAPGIHRYGGDEPLPEGGPPRPADPLALLAQAAGVASAERWWEDVVEHRGAVGAFEAVAEAMAAVREDLTPDSVVEQRREAHMRKVLRATIKEGFERIAVVVGAWHVPALTEPLPPASHDARRLRKLPRVKVDATLVPWTNRRLAASSGYGAGVTSPGWYAHLFATDGDPVAPWFARVAGLLRDEGLLASPDQAIAATLLAGTLAALRGRPQPGLEECTEAALATLCGGSRVALGTVTDRLVIGTAIGQVPASTPAVPLVADVRATQRRLRFRPRAEATAVDLDLRTPMHLERSHLLHRLRLLGVPWGREQAATSTGTFRESWLLEWHPDHEVALVDASRHGPTLAGAAASKAIEAARDADRLAPLCRLAEEVLRAALPTALPGVLAAIADRAAAAFDVGEALDALDPLARLARYGDVRDTDTAAVVDVLEGLAARAFAGLPAACAHLDEDAARQMVVRLGAATTAMGTLGDDALRGDLHRALAAVTRRERLHPLVAGKAWRLRRDAGDVPTDEATRALSAALSRATEPAAAAAWAEGFLTGSGEVLLVDHDLLAAVDRWLSGLPADAFQAVLPLVRRTFASFAAGERRGLADAIARGPTAAGPTSAVHRPLDRQRADAAAAAVDRLLVSLEAHR